MHFCSGVLVALVVGLRYLKVVPEGGNMWLESECRRARGVAAVGGGGEECG